MAAVPTRTPEAEPTRIVPRGSPGETDDTGALADARPAFSIPFSGEAADVTDAGRGRLRDLAKQMANDPRMQVQIFAYASGSDETASKARRLSLSRALSVRALLLDEGIRSTRIVVRPLGNQTARQPADRVDVMTSGAS
jgi:outer membrane protein OmpA-like peptidoglycan-associated protein